MIVQPDNAKDFITTKIYEIIYSGTPIILISNHGKLADFIKSNELGVCFTPKNFIEGFESFLNNTTPTFKLKEFPIDNYSFNYLTLELVSLLKHTNC